MASHHAPLLALQPVDWASVPCDDLSTFLQETFDQALVVVNSVPDVTKLSSEEASPGRLRAKTESAVGISSASRLQAIEKSEASRRLGQDWKEIKINPRDNPKDISVFKLGSKDGKGSWFARHSVHEELSFDDWKMGLKKEFEESMKVQGSPGSGNIRGIGADKAVEHRMVESVGQLDVFQLSAQFPGPTSPRDFVTLLLTSDLSYRDAETSQPLRQYIVVSKPCIHASCPSRSGIIRGQYESVEIIREVPLRGKPLKRSLSSTDQVLESSLSMQASTLSIPAKTTETEEVKTAVEWLMVTRSDPGGSVPRFLIEKGTPPGIVGDAGKFIAWVVDMAARGFQDKPAPSSKEDDTEGGEKVVPTAAGVTADDAVKHTPVVRVNNEAGPNGYNYDGADDDTAPSSNGIYGIISGIFGAASYVVPTSLIQSFSGSISNGGSDIGSLSSRAIPEEEDDDSFLSDDSSIRSFASALEKRLTAENILPQTRPHAGSITESVSEDSRSISTLPAADKELRRLQERRRKLDVKLALMQSKMESKRQGDKDKDSAAMNKMREKHDKEVAKQEEKFKRELKKLEDKKELEARKAEKRRRKTLEKEEKSNMALEMERLRSERDFALKHAQLLQDQVQDLQTQNTLLVAKLGKLGAVDSAEFTKQRTSSSSP